MVNLIDGKRAVHKPKEKNKLSARQVINATLCIDLSYLCKHSKIEKRPYATHGVIKTEHSELISFELNYGNEEQNYIDIFYSLIPSVSYHLQIELVEVPSNLGKGSFLYFICPVTGLNCRKLYKLPFLDKWASRAAYKGQLYYPFQICSRLQLYSERFNSIKVKCKTLGQMRNTNFYSDKPTRRHIRAQNLLESKQKAYDDLWLPAAIPVTIQKVIQPELIKGLSFLVDFD